MNLTCRGCEWFSERIVGTDEDGEPVPEYRCESRILTEAEAVFGCGLYRKKRERR